MDALLLVWSGVIHLRPFFDGYRKIPPIGSLFLAQAIAASALAALLLVRPRPLEALAGALLVFATVGGLLLATTIGLFGFHDSLAASFAWTAFVDELTGGVLLLSALGLGLRSRESWW